MKSALLLAASGLCISALAITSITACAEAGDPVPDNGGGGTANQEPQGDNKASLPAPTGGGTSSGNASGSSSTSSSSSSTSSSSGGSSSGSTSSGGGSAVPACSWAGDFTKAISKFQEIQAQKPCDATCNPTTHCCYDALGGGLPGGGGGGGVPGLDDAGLGGGGGGGMGGSCVSN